MSLTLVSRKHVFGFIHYHCLPSWIRNSNLSFSIRLACGRILFEFVHHPCIIIWITMRSLSMASRKHLSDFIQQPHFLIWIRMSSLNIRNDKEKKIDINQQIEKYIEKCLYNLVTIREEPLLENPLFTNFPLQTDMFLWLLNVSKFKFKWMLETMGWSGLHWKDKDNVDVLYGRLGGFHDAHAITHPSSRSQ